MIIYGMPTYNRQDLLENAITAARAGTVQPDKFIIVDNGAIGKARDILEESGVDLSNVEIIDADENLGCSITWNMFMAQSTNDDFVIIANDDVAVHQQAIEALVTAAKEYPENPMYTGSGHSGNSFSLFVMRKWAWEKIGKFDENFKPAYFEDNDAHYRLKLLGLDFISLEAATFDHVGSGTLRAMTRAQIDIHHKKFARNEKYYIEKWGGKPGEEIYTIPFNGQDEKLILAKIKDQFTY